MCLFRYVSDISGYKSSDAALSDTLEFSDYREKEDTKINSLRKGKRVDFSQ